MRTISALAILLLTGCVLKHVHKENIVPVPVVLPLKMCAQSGVAMSRGSEGERMLCERLIPLGTHLAQCVCRDEGLIVQQAQDTQQVMDQLLTQPTTRAK
jgi:hypothetical protein